MQSYFYTFYAAPLCFTFTHCIRFLRLSVCLPAGVRPVRACNLNTMRYDSVYLTCNKKLTGSQHSLPHGMNKKLKCETKNKMMSVIGPVQSRYREAIQ